MNRMLLVALLALSAGAQAQPPERTAPNWRFVGAEAGRPGAVVRNAPFSADVTTETSMVLQDGNHVKQTSTQRVYRDSEGRTRREQSLKSVGGLASNTNLPPVVFINDPVAGANYALSPTAKTFTKSVGGGRGAQGNRGGRIAATKDAGGMGRRMRGPGSGGNSQNAKTESLGSKSVEGVLAEGTRTTITVPAGQIGNEQPFQTMMETWYSADLQMVVLSKRSDPLSGETVTRYTNINRSEPPHSLFEVPADYKPADPGVRSGSK